MGAFRPNAVERHALCGTAPRTLREHKSSAWPWYGRLRADLVNLACQHAFMLLAL
jgi:hypothetical protein